MWKLMKLEYKKNHIGTYIRNAVVLAVILGIFLFALTYLGIAKDPDTGQIDAAPGSEMISASVELFTGMVYLIFTSVMLASFIVAPYKNKTMQLMFSYPVSRKKILASQMLAVWCFNILALIISKLLIYGCISIGARYMDAAFMLDFNLSDVSFYAQIIAKSAVTVSLCFSALFVGLKLRSTKAVIITAFLLIFLTQANIGDLTMSNNAILPAALILISLGFAFLSVQNVEKKDLM